MDDLLEIYARQLLESQPDQVTVAWQGGEPTLMGWSFSGWRWIWSRNIAGGRRRSNIRFRQMARGWTMSALVCGGGCEMESRGVTDRTE
jgi:hypothetical protein